MAEATKPVRVYVDMVGDLWHYGHANFCKQARELGTYLIVGINRDEHCITYKRKPILSTIERVRSAQDEVLYEDTELIVTKEFIVKHRIDIIAHGDDFDPAKIKLYYSAPIELGIFRTLPYTPGISTTDILKRIKSYQEQGLLAKV